MTLITLLVALAIAHFARDIVNVRRTTWVAPYGAWVTQRLPAHGIWDGPAGVLVLLAPPVIGVVIVQLLLGELLWGLGGFVIALAVLVYSWGPRDLDADVDTYLTAAEQGPEAEREAAANLVDAPLPAGDYERAGYLVSGVTLAALERWFSVALWFVVLGPAGALLYRLTDVLASDAPARVHLSPEQAGAAQRLRALLEWPAAQAMVGGLAIVADFDAVVSGWRAHYRERGRGYWDLDAGFLVRAVQSTLRGYPDTAHGFEDHLNGPIDCVRHTINLMWRVLFVWLTALAVLTLIGWLG